MMAGRSHDSTVAPGVAQRPVARSISGVTAELGGVQRCRWCRSRRWGIGAGGAGAAACNAARHPADGAPGGAGGTGGAGVKSERTGRWRRCRQQRGCFVRRKVVPSGDGGAGEESAQESRTVRRMQRGTAVPVVRGGPVHRQRQERRHRRSEARPRSGNGGDGGAGVPGGLVANGARQGSAGGDGGVGWAHPAIVLSGTGGAGTRRRRSCGR